MKANLFRAIAALLTLSFCYWGIRLRPRRPEVPVRSAAEGLSPEEARQLMERAGGLIRAERFEEALPLAQRILREFPDNPIYLRRLAEIRERLGHFKEAAELWEHFLKVAPSPGEACPSLGNAYRNLGRLDASIDAFERCLALEPHNSDFQFYLAKAYETGKRYDKALKTYRVAAGRAPDYPDLTIGWARMEVFIGDPARAQQLVERVLTRNPSNVDALLVAGMAHRQQGAYDKARQCLERGLRLSPTNADFLAVLGGVAEAQDRPGEARTLYDRYLARRPGDAAIAQRRARLDREQP